MTDVLAHRGPDGSGALLAFQDGTGFRHELVVSADRETVSVGSAAAGLRVGLGHRRLAILDTSARGLQPMMDRTENTAVILNGEIYNFRDLRRELSRLGHRFETGTDTEVLLAAYLEWGERCLARLKGMFAFAIWDGRTSRMLCARDRFGIKPLYYVSTNGLLAFASEIKALFELPNVPRVADDEAVFEFLIHGNCDFVARTAAKEVNALPPAHQMIVDVARGSFDVRPYYELEISPNGARSDAERVDQVREGLGRSVREHLVSDVPMGSCLSGGLDSSSVVGLVAQVARDDPSEAQALGPRLQTFTSCYDDASVDEREYALPAAHFVGAKSHLVFPTPQGFADAFPKMAWHLDMPFGALSVYAQWCVMRSARENGITVLLDGQGGDEVFGGYGKFRYGYLASLLRSARLGLLAKEAVAAARAADPYLLNIRNGYRYLPGPVRRWLGVDSLLQKSLRQDVMELVGSESTPATRWWRYAREGATHPSVVQRLQVDDLTLDTLPQLLRFEDRSSMAFSVEARVPILDHEVVEAGLALPDHLKISGGWSKFALRQAMEGLIPEVVRWRRTKLGFAAPDRSWLSGDLRPLVLDLLGAPLRADKYVDGRALRDAYARAASRPPTTEAYLGLFRVLSLEMWMRAFDISAR